MMNLFRDDNQINEKSVAGFVSLLVMISFAVADIVASYVGKPLVINEFIFNAFLVLTLGSLGIASVDKYINSKREGSKSTEETEEA